MTSQPQPAPGEGRSAGQYLRPLRDLAAYALVGATALLLFVAIIRLIPDSGLGFSNRTPSSFGNFINLATIAFPLVAVLLSLLVEPRHPKAQLIVVIAVVEYAVMAVFGLLFGVLIGLVNEAADAGARSAFEGLIERVAWLAVFGVAAYAVYSIWRNMFYTAKPKPQPGVYGAPQYHQPGAYPGQPGYGPPPGQPGPPPGQPGPPMQYGPPPQGGYPPAPGQPGHSAPGMYGQPAPSWNQPQVTMPVGQPNQATQPVPAPASAPPAPASAPPASAPPAPVPPAAFSEPTQVVPRAEPKAPDAHQPYAEKDRTDADRTEKIGDDRPGFGPAEQDRPRQ
ncbi:hypothetical protein GCM10010172_12220 [Paractinoplanes ferrugineus]|uniref:hypothetical protein n=1 Tax=Paractinoplanes ferrugineus TaxID=113564 RepID=UPI0031D32A1C